MVVTSCNNIRDVGGVVNKKHISVFIFTIDWLKMVTIVIPTYFKLIPNTRFEKIFLALIPVLCVWI